MGANPHANGGILLHKLRLPEFRDYAIAVPEPGKVHGRGHAHARQIPSQRDHAQRRSAELPDLWPDETASNRLTAVFEATNKQWEAEVVPTDDHLAMEGQHCRNAHEHQCEGWLEGYLLTGRHGLV